MDESPEAKLRSLFQGLVLAAVTRRRGIALAIENGAAGAAGGRTGEGDAIGTVNTQLIAEALRVEGAAWNSEDLRDLVPLEKVDDSGFPYVLTVGEVGKGEEACQEPWCWALRMGYARDRVIAYSRVKQAILDTRNLSTSPELGKALRKVWGRANAELRRAELALKHPNRDRPSNPAMEIMAQRQVWERAGQDLQGAHRQQPTLLRKSLVEGLTARELGAMAIDPLLKEDATHAVAAATRDLMPERDALIGTETFVSFTFPAVDHEELYAVGATEVGVRTTEKNEGKMPALVTMHNPTGALTSWKTPSGLMQNTFFTTDAAELLAKLHTLIVSARTNVSGDGTWTPLPLEGQRNYLLLEHPTL